MRREEIIHALGAEWRHPVAPELYDPRMYQRVELLRGKISIIDEWLPEYLSGGATVLDFSCGTGALLEVMRYYGNEILGADIQYFEFLESQGLPYQYVNGRFLPYPFSDRSWDLLTCIGSISMYRQPWRDVVTEFCRIARKHVFLVVNVGEEFERRKHELIGWAPDGWRLDVHRRSAFRWARLGN